MSLPSQSARSGVGSRAYTRSRRRAPIQPRGAAAIVVVILAAGTLIGWQAWPTGKKGAGSAGLDSPKDPGSAPSSERTELAGASPEVIRTEPPVEIRMGHEVEPLAASDRVPVLPNPGPQAPAGEAAKPTEVKPSDSARPDGLAGASDAARAIADEARQAADPVKARALYSRALASGSLSEADAEAIRRLASAVNDDLIFSSRAAPGDGLSTTYAVQSGDSLVRIASKLSPSVDWRFIQRVNKIADPHKIRVGQKLKVVKGPFHAIVTKSAYRLDLYAGEGEERLYVRSFVVGLGESDGTPTGTFIVKPGSKLINPHWVNPRTGQAFNADDPENPIGERWLGLEGEGASAGLNGYGIHGTIDPESIGKQRSMGCVRLSAADIEVLYELLGEGVSRVEIRP